MANDSYDPGVDNIDIEDEAEAEIKTIELEITDTPDNYDEEFKTTSVINDAFSDITTIKDNIEEACQLITNYITEIQNIGDTPLPEAIVNLTGEAIGEKIRNMIETKKETPEERKAKAEQELQDDERIAYDNWDINHEYPYIVKKSTPESTPDQKQTTPIQT